MGGKGGAKGRKGGRGYSAPPPPSRQADFKEAQLHPSVGEAKGGGKKGGGRSGKGRGQRAPEAPAAPEPPAKVAAAPAEAGDDGGDDGESSKVTRALVDALRAFSTPQWWLIGSEDAQARSAIRKRIKPEEFKEKCTERHAQMRKVYESTMSQDSEQRWLRKVSSEGTAGDRVASLTMLIQVCPVFATPYIKSLMTMAARTERSDSIMAVDALKDLFVSTLLPDRKLKTFAQMEAVAPKALGKVQWTQLSVTAFFEDYLKTAFAGFIHILSQAAHSSVAFFKTKAVRTAYELLAAKPEQERALLQLLVNKFGDHAAKVSSNVSFHLKHLLEKHPVMKLVVVKEVEAFLARKNLTHNSAYVAVMFLSEMPLLKRADAAVASELVKLFVSRLELALQPKPRPAKAEPRRIKAPGGRMRWAPAKRKKWKPGFAEEDNRLVRTLVNGIQRAMPYLDATVSSVPLQEETINALFKVCHTVTAFSTRIAILSLLNRCLFEKIGVAPDRFYRLVYEQIGQFDLFSCSHRHQAFVLMQRVLPDDTSVARAVAMGRRMLQVGANAAPTVAVASLLVLSSLLSARRAELKPLLQTCEADLWKQLDAGADDDADDERFVDDEVATERLAAAAEGERPRYAPTVRDPRFAKARGTPLWELYALRNHVHPFVAQGTSKLLQAEKVELQGGGPFEAFSQQELLQQFCTSSRLSRATKEKGNKLGNKGKETKVRVSYASERFVNKWKVPPHEKFLQLYFSDAVVKKQQELKKEARKEKEEDVDEEGKMSSAGEEEADQFLEEQLKGENMSEDDEDPDMDDDSDLDGLGGEGGESEAGGEGCESSAAGSDEEADAGEQGAEEEAAQRGEKRRGDPITNVVDMRKRLKAEKTKAKTSGNMFASAEDFAHLLAADDDAGDE